MASQAEPEIILYDLACTKNVCFSPVVWRIRMMLNYKSIAYRTIFLEFQDIEPTLKALNIEPSPSASESAPRYTVPAIHHVPTNTYLMDSKPIAELIESMYPERAVPLKSQHGERIEAAARAMSETYQLSTMSREPSILSPVTQQYFRRTRTAALNRALEFIADPDKEEQAWVEASSSMHATSELIRTNRVEGPFVLGAQPSYTDFFIAGNLQCARVIDEGIFERMVKFDGFKIVYEACLPFMEKRN